MATLFTKIIQGEISSHKVAETEEFYAFLDINPNTKGHTLCITKKEVNKIFDLDKETYLGLMEFSRKVAIAIEKAVPCERVGMSVIGLEVPHVHVHLIPLHNMENARFTTKQKLSSTEFEVVASLIAKNYNEIG
jgi:histidine triad (HIT) family protein